MKYAARDRMAARLRYLAEWIQENGHKLPGVPYMSDGALRCYLTVNNYERNAETGNYEAIFNEEATKENLRRFLLAVGSCEKDYKDDRLVIRKLYWDGTTMIEGTVDRALTCKKKVVGQKLVQATYIPSKLVDEVEWECDESASLLKLVS